MNRPEPTSFAEAYERAFTDNVEVYFYMAIELDDPMPVYDVYMLYFAMVNDKAQYHFFKEGAD